MSRIVLWLFLLLPLPALHADALSDAMSAYQAGDYAQALGLLRPLAEQGNTEAQRRLGVMYRHGVGVARDDAQAVLWYERAAEGGHVLAQNSLGVMYQFGLGVAADPARAVHWLNAAAQQGHAKAQENLGLLLIRGDSPVPADPSKAAHWLMAAARQNQGRAQLSLGLLYLAGNGVEHNDRLGMNWIERAARQGLPEARAAMAKAYRDGLYGMPRDPQLAQQWEQR